MQFYKYSDTIKEIILLLWLTELLHNFKEELHSSPEVIKAHLMNHIAAINPKLAQQIIQSPTEAHVLEIISKVEVIASTKAANDERFALAA